MQIFHIQTILEALRRFAEQFFESAFLILTVTQDKRLNAIF